LGVGPDSLAVWGAWASFAGVALSVLGFGATLVTVVRARSAAEAARATADQTLTRVRSIDVIYGVTDIMSQLEHILELQRAGQLEGLRERYARVRRQMIALRTADRFASDEDLLTVNEAITFCAKGEKMIGRRLSRIDGVQPDDAALHELGEALSDTIDEMYKIGASLKNDAESGILESRGSPDA